MTRAKWIAWMGGIGMLGLPLGDVRGQTPAPASTAAPAAETRQMRPRNALETGVDLYNKQEYEEAGRYLQQASQGRQQLSAAHQARLDEFLKKNTEAANGRQQALAQLKKAEEAVKAGQVREAETMLKELRSNKHLKAKEQQQVTALTDQVKGKSGSRWALFSKPAANKPDADAILAEARKAYEQGDLDKAEALAKESEQAGHSSWLYWSDTPAKVVADVQAARAKLAAKPADAKSAAPADKNSAARELLKQANAAIEAGDTAKARQLVKQAEDLKPTLPYWEPLTPEKLKSAIARAEGAKKAASAMAAAPAADKLAEGPDARALVKEARKAYEENKLDQAEELARKARVAGVAKWGLFEDSPDKVLSDVVKAREGANQIRAAELLAEARKKMDANQLDDAEKLCYQAEALRPNYPIWYRGERADRLKAEILVKRKQLYKPTLPVAESNVAVKAVEPKKTETVAAAPASPPSVRPAAAAQDPKLDQARQLVVQARLHLNKGDYAKAATLAHQASSLGVMLPAGEDRPEEILAAVKAVEASRSARQNPQVAELARQKALQFLAEARALQKEERIIDALRLVREAEKQNAIYQPMDDQPEAVAAELKRDCQAQMKKFTDAAQTLKAAGRQADAEKYESYVQQLAVVYGMPAGVVVQASVKDGVAPVDGTQLLTQARGELVRGNLSEARKLAEAAYAGPFNLKPQANQLLGEIDDAESRRTVKRSQDLYEAGARAFARKEYEVAGSYLQNVDVKLLDERRRTHLQEMIASKEMRQHLVTQASAKLTVETADAGKAATSDQPPAGDDKPSLLSEVQVRQKIELERLRQQKLQSEQQAVKLAGQGNLDQAVETLKGALEQLRASSLDAELVAPMQRQLEDRLKRFNTMREQVAYEKMQREQLSAKAGVGQRKFLAEERKQEQVAELMQKYATFMREGKYKEAATVAMMAREIDPDNVAVDAAVFKADMLRNTSNSDRTQRNRGLTFASAMGEVNDAMATEVDGNHPVSYDKDFLSKAGRKDKKYLPVRPTTEKDREVNHKLGTTVSVSFNNEPLGQVLDKLREMTGTNIVPDEPALAIDGVSLEHPVKIKLDGVQMKTALSLILRNARLTYVVKDGVVLVTTPAGERGKLIEKIYPVADLIVSPQDFGSLTGKVSSLADKGSGTNQLVASASNGLNWDVMGAPAASQSVNPPASIPGSSMGRNPRTAGGTMEDVLIKLITQTIEPQSWEDMGGSGHIDYYPLGMTLVVAQTPDIQERVQELLDRLRELQQLQVTVEVRLLTLSDSFYERIGIDLDIQIDDDQTKFDQMVAANAFAPPGLLNEPDHLEHVWVGMTPTGEFTRDLDIPIDFSSFNLATPPFGNFPNQPGQNGGLSMGVAFLSDIEVYLFMEAAQGDRRRNVLQAPKITLFNGQTATLTSQTSQFFVTQVIPITNPFTGVTTFLPVNTQFPSGLSLTIQAVVSADRRYVQLTVIPQIQNVTTGGTFTPVPGITLEQPVTQLLSVQTTVSVPDGGTILMGGLKQFSEGKNEFGPPILSKIPYISRLVRNTGYGRETTTLMMLVTPRIIIPEEEEERLGQTFAF